MAINITKVLDEIQTRLDDSTQTDRSLTALIAASNRIDNSGTGVLTYRSTGHLPQYTDSAYYGTIAYVEVDNVFGDSSGRFYYGSSRDSGWIQFTTLQDSDEATITVPPSGPSNPAYVGTNYGYSMGGGSSPYTQNIDQYSYASDGNATNVGAMDNPDSTAVWTGTGGGSETHGYHMGGTPVAPLASPIFKFPYTSGTPISDTTYDVGANQIHRYGHYEMCGDRTNIYIVGGYRGPSYPTLSNRNTILNFAASSDGATITDYGDLSASKRYANTGSSDTYGYAVGGYTSVGLNVIEKWPFSAAGNATDVGDLLHTSYAAAASSSGTHGYLHGGLTPGATNVIQKYPFSTDGDATDVGDILAAKHSGTGTSSGTHGYQSGGSPAVNTIQKFSFSTDGDATDVGDLAFSRIASAGTHY